MLSSSEIWHRTVPKWTDAWEETSVPIGTTRLYIPEYDNTDKVTELFLFWKYDVAIVMLEKPEWAAEFFRKWRHECSVPLLCSPYIDLADNSIKTAASSVPCLPRPFSFTMSANVNFPPNESALKYVQIKHKNGSLYCGAFT
jgi:hypothetical protein